MAERLCGYCRETGHRKPSCPMFHEHRNLVLTHTPKERKRLLEYLGKIGLGNGAMIKFDPDWYNISMGAIGIIHDFEWVSACSFFDVRNVRYSKQVKIDTRSVEKDYYYRSIHVNYLATGNGFSDHRNLGIRISRFIDKINGVTHREAAEWDDPHWEIVSPSHDIDYDPDILIRHVYMPRRLLMPGEQEWNGWGIMPSDAP